MLGQRPSLTGFLEPYLISYKTKYVYCMFFSCAVFLDTLHTFWGLLSNLALVKAVGVGPIVFFKIQS